MSNSIELSETFKNRLQGPLLKQSHYVGLGILYFCKLSYTQETSNIGSLHWFRTGWLRNRLGRRAFMKKFIEFLKFWTTWMYNHIKKVIRLKLFNVLINQSINVPERILYNGPITGVWRVSPFSQPPICAPRLAFTAPRFYLNIPNVSTHFTLQSSPFGCWTAYCFVQVCVRVRDAINIITEAVAWYNPQHN